MALVNKKNPRAYTRGWICLSYQPCRRSRKTDCELSISRWRHWHPHSPGKICRQRLQAVCAVCIEGELCLRNTWESWGKQVKRKHDGREIKVGLVKTTRSWSTKRTARCIHSGLDLFVLPAMQTTLQDGMLVEHQPLATLASAIPR